MALSTFTDRNQEPRKDELAVVLDRAAELRDQLIFSIASRLDPLDEDWVYSGKKWGWALRLKHKKRAVLYMTPSEGFFYVGFALGQRAVDAAHESDLAPAVLGVIDNSPRYAEGRGVRLEVRVADDVRNAVQLAKIKMLSHESHAVRTMRRVSSET